MAKINFSVFPPFHKLINTKAIDRSLHFVWCLNGKFYITNGFALLVSDVINWVEDEEQRRALEGKLLSYDLVKALNSSKVFTIEYKDKSIKVTDKSGKETMYAYSGVLNSADSHTFSLLDTLGNANGETLRCPNFSSVISSAFNDVVDAPFTSFRAELIFNVSKCFVTNHKLGGDGVVVTPRNKNRAFIIKSAKDTMLKGEEFAILMPILYEEK